jgi:hypothetical protein
MICQVGRALHEIEAMDFFNVLTGPELLEQTEAHLPEHRERLYAPTVALAMFMRQALNEDGSCQKAVNGWAAQRVAEGLRPNGVETGASRSRLRRRARRVTESDQYRMPDVSGHNRNEPRYPAVWNDSQSAWRHSCRNGVSYQRLDHCELDVR